MTFVKLYTSGAQFDKTTLLWFQITKFLNHIYIKTYTPTISERISNGKPWLTNSQIKLLYGRVSNGKPWLANSHIKLLYWRTSNGKPWLTNSQIKLLYGRVSNGKPWLAKSHIKLLY